MNPNHCISIYLVVEYIYYSNEVYANKLILYSKFIGYEDNSYYSIHYIQENIILHSIHAIFYEEFFSKYTDSYVKEFKLYNKLLNKISLETELLVSGPSSKDRPTSVPILYIPIPPFKTILLISLHLFFLISFHLPYLFQGLKSL